MEAVEEQSSKTKKNKNKVRFSPLKIQEYFVKCYGSAHSMVDQLNKELGKDLDTFDVWRQTNRHCGVANIDDGREFTSDLARHVTVSEMKNGNLRAVKLWYEQASKAEDSKFRKAVLKRLRAGEISVTDAALEFEIAGLALPETLKILLSRAEPEPLDPTGGAYSTFDPEAFDKRLQERFETLQSQLDGLPERRAEIQKLRDETADSFGPDAETRNGPEK